MCEQRQHLGRGGGIAAQGQLILRLGRDEGRVQRVAQAIVLPVEERPHMTDLGPWYDVCRPGCCENARLGFKPAFSGIAP